jgi:hypothetical protein
MGNISDQGIRTDTASPAAKRFSLALISLGVGNSTGEIVTIQRIYSLKTVHIIAKNRWGNWR